LHSRLDLDRDNGKSARACEAGSRETSGFTGSFVGGHDAQNATAATGGDPNAWGSLWCGSAIKTGAPTFGTNARKRSGYGLAGHTGNAGESRAGGPAAKTRRNVDEKAAGVFHWNTILPHQETNHRVSKKLFETGIRGPCFGEPGLMSQHHSRALPGVLRTLRYALKTDCVVWLHHHSKFCIGQM
jgi:hypothetical protein